MTSQAEMEDCDLMEQCKIMAFMDMVATCLGAKKNDGADVGVPLPLGFDSAKDLESWPLIQVRERERCLFGETRSVMIDLYLCICICLSVCVYSLLFLNQAHALDEMGGKGFFTARYQVQDIYADLMEMMSSIDAAFVDKALSIGLPSLRYVCSVGRPVDLSASACFDITIFMFLMYTGIMSGSV